MTLQELYEQIDKQLKVCPRKGGDVVCVEVADSNFGGTSVIPVKFAHCGFDWDDGKFIIRTDKKVHV